MIAKKINWICELLQIQKRAHEQIRLVFHRFIEMNRQVNELSSLVQTFTNVFLTVAFVVKDQPLFRFGKPF